MMKRSKLTGLVLLLAVAPCPDTVAGTESPEAVVAGIDERVDRMSRAESGKPLVRAPIRKPLAKGRGNFVRHYSWSLVSFAARCLYSDGMPDDANAALTENARHYLDNPDDINDRDSFHWHAEIVMRLIEMYGTRGTKRPGRISKETEALALEPIWHYVRESSRLAKAEHEQSKSKTWHICGKLPHFNPLQIRPVEQSGKMRNPATV